MRRSALERLRDASEHAEAVVRYVSGRTFADYLTDDFLRAAVERRLEIVGEALGVAWRMLPRLDEAIPEVAQIVATRHRLAHGYDGLSHDILWTTATEELADLLASLQRLIAMEETELTDRFGA
jgi:uncharacterized protein with HEPN domain